MDDSGDESKASITLTGGSTASQSANTKAGGDPGRTQDLMEGGCMAVAVKKLSPEATGAVVSGETLMKHFHSCVQSLTIISKKVGWVSRTCVFRRSSHLAAYIRFTG